MSSLYLSGRGSGGVGRTLKISGVLFDLDDTLIDRGSAFRRLAGKLYDAEPAIRNSHTRNEAVRLIEEFDKGGYSAKPYWWYVRERWPEIKRSDPEFTTWHEVTFPWCFEASQGVLRLLDDMDRANLQWGIITNGGPIQRRKIAACGLGDRARCVVVSSEVGIAKPDSVIFEDGLKRLGVSASSALFAGDNPYTDIAGAHAVGMKTAWVRMGRDYPQDAPRPDYTIERVTDLRPLLGL